MTFDAEVSHASNEKKRSSRSKPIVDGLAARRLGVLIDARHTGLDLSFLQRNKWDEEHEGYLEEPHNSTDGNFVFWRNKQAGAAASEMVALHGLEDVLSFEFGGRVRKGLNVIG